MDYQEYRKVQDNIYGFIDFESRIWKFIDTSEFQKLRYIKQLGCLYQIFPGATHTRFQHSLGTGHLAKTFLQHLIKNHDKLQEYSTDQKKKNALFTVTLAGIMHDVGHGPFSHTFDNEVVNTLVQQADSDKLKEKWNHQLGSQIIFRNIAQRLGEKIIKKEQIQRVIRLINHKVTQQDERPWQFQLISNKITGIDVDKLDYFRRDAYYLGAKGIHINHQLLMRQARLLKNDEGKLTICYPLKYALTVNQVFFARYKLYKTYYLNNKAKGIELMILDSLNLVKSIFKFNQICRKIRKGKKFIKDYISLTDSILERIQLYDQKSVILQDNPKLLNDLREAKVLLKRIKTRKIYKFIREVQTALTQQNLKSNKDTLEKIFNVQNIKNDIINRVGNLQLKKLFHVVITDIGYGLKNSNPLNFVNFFRKQLKDWVIIPKNQLKSQDISILYTKSFAERHAKLYVKNGATQAQVDLINEYFHKYFDENITENQGANQDANSKPKLVLSHVNLGRTQHISLELTNLDDFDEDQDLENDLPLNKDKLDLFINESKF